MKKAKEVSVRIGKKVRKLDEAGLLALPRTVQIEVAVGMGIGLRRGVSKKGLAMLILAKGK